MIDLHEGKKGVKLEYVLGKQVWGSEKRRMGGKEIEIPFSLIYLLSFKSVCNVHNSLFCRQNISGMDKALQSCPLKSLGERTYYKHEL